ncbi:quinone oxidoreductase 2 [Trichoderma cornu-damae]|uniref:Quinone oxidoreductase 2 n=1 Tax=Trichoderma cornu-damae TaxID=654480 RepID=A0A9P8QUH6_9HYPO|nr:quinone oxidoreductase 2 [Trichoderma cornu-damae]
MIFLTGTSGGIGGAALETILDHKLLHPNEFSISSWNGQTKSQKATEAGVQVRRGDFTKPETLVHTFDGAEALFLVSHPSVGEERFIYHRNAIDAAKKSGVKHIIYTSLTFGGLDGEHSLGGVAQAHVRTVAYLKASGLKWTIIRYATFQHLWNNFAGFLRLEKDSDAEVVIPNDGPNHWAHRADMGEATGRILGNWRSYEEKTICLTGPELLTISDVIQLYRDYTGRKVNVKIVGTESAIEYHKQHKTLPPEQEDFLPNWASWHGALAEGEMNFIDPALENLLGRKPKTVKDLAHILFAAETNELDTTDFNGVA